MNLKEFVEKKIITNKDLLKIKQPLPINDIPVIHGEEISFSIEKLIDFILSNYGCLAHGSIINIKDPFIKSKVFASSVARIALLKSLLLNDKGLNYPYSMDQALEVTINGEPSSKTINKKGFVYLIPNKKDFKNKPSGSWQWISNKDKPYIAKIETRLSDFKYPVFKRIRIIN